MQSQNDHNEVSEGQINKGIYIQSRYGIPMSESIKSRIMVILRQMMAEGTITQENSSVSTRNLAIQKHFPNKSQGS